MLKDKKAGEIIETNNFIFEEYDIKLNDEIYNRIINKSYRENDYVSYKDLAYIKLLHYGYDNKVKVGELIIHKAVVNEMKKVFNDLFNIKYQINSMHLIDNYWINNDGLLSDRKSIEHNNSSSFCFRIILNTTKLSNHAYGIAIDINPFDNPYAPKDENKEFDYSRLTPYEKDLMFDREEKAKTNRHIITLNDEICKIFESVGYECGGIWPSRGDTLSCDWQHFEPNKDKMKEIMTRIETIHNK